MIQGNDVALFLSGQSVPLPSCNIVISQPTVKEIVLFGEDQFFITVQMFGNADSFVKKIKEGNPELEGYSNFQIVMMLIDRDENTRQNVENFFELVFPIYDIRINEQDLVFILKDTGDMVGMVTTFNYEEFFNVVGKLFIMHSKKKDEIDYNPADARANAIAEKLKKGREKVAEIKSKNSGNENMSIFGTYTSVLSVGLNIDINVLFNYTPFQLYDAFSRYWAKASYDFYQKIASTPLMDVSKMDAPEEWSSNIYK